MVSASSCYGAEVIIINRVGTAFHIFKEAENYRCLREGAQRDHKVPKSHCIGQQQGQTPSSTRPVLTTKEENIQPS